MMTVQELGDAQKVCLRIAEERVLDYNSAIATIALIVRELLIELERDKYPIPRYADKDDD